MLCAVIVAAGLIVPPPSPPPVTGRVLDPNGNPARATVRVYAAESPREATARQAAGRARPVLASAQTAEDGTFRIAAPPHAVVEAAASGFLPDAALSGDPALTLELRPESTARGVVRGPAGPVAGAIVAWTSAEVEVLAITTADGSYRVPSGRAAQVRVFHADFASQPVPMYGTSAGAVQLVPGTAVSGAVTDPAGRPAAGAEIWLDGFLPGGKTDAQGRFRVAHAPDEWGQVIARSGRLVAAAQRRSGPLSLRLGPARTLSGTVREEGTRAPLAGVTVTAFEGGPLGRAVTDAQGQYAIDDLVPGTYRVWATGSGLTTNPAAATAEDTIDLVRAPAARRDLVLVRPPTLRGRVEDEQRRPIAGAAVGLGFKGPQVYAVAGIDLDMDPSSGATVRTGADGGFALPIPLSSEGQAVKALGFERSVVVLRHGFAVGTAPVPAVPGPPLVLTLRRGVELRGRVVSADGAPVPDARIYVAESGTLASTMVPMHALLPGLGDENAWTRTDAAGSFSVSVHKAPHELAVQKTGYASRTLRDQQPGAAPVEVVLDPAAFIRGRVVRADGRGVSGARVAASTEMQASPREPAETSADGTFAVGDLTPGLYSLDAQHPQLGAIGSRMVEAPAQDVVFALPAAGAVRGRAVDAQSREVLRRFTVSVTAADEDQPWQRQGTVDEATGAFVVEDVPEGTVTVRAAAEGYANAAVEDVTVVADAEPAEVEIALRSDLAVTGQVTNEAGVPVPAHVNGKAKDGAGSGSATADAEGRYELRGLPAGEVEIRAQARGYVQETRTVDTRQGARVDLVLKHGLALRGEVVSDGAPVAMVGVFANGKGRGASSYATTDERGRFTLEGLEPGRYAVSARAADGRQAEVDDVDAGQQAPLRIVLERKATGVITGRVVGLPTEGDPMMAFVQANGENGSGMAPVDGTHRFRMTDAPAGAVTVQAEAMSMNGTQRSSRPVELTLAANSESEVVLEFPDDVVIGGLITRDGAPVPFATVNFSRDDAPSAATRADARGAYQLVGVEPGRHAVTVTATDPQTAFATEYMVTGSAEFDIDIAGAVLTGRAVRADTGAPVAGVDVSLFRAGEGQTASTATTNAQGAWSARSLREGSYRVVTSKAGFGQVVRDVEIARASPADLTLELEPADGVGLTVVDGRDGRTLDAIVVVRDAQKRIVANQHSGVGDDGTLNIALADGSYVLSTSATGYGTATLPVTAPSSGLRVALTPGGTLVLASERSLHGRVRLVQPDGEEYVRCWCNGIAAIQLKGRRTTVENVTAGSYTVEVVDGIEGIAPRPAVVREGQTTTVTLE